ncbi:MAG: sialate O-acetylesterase [Bacteroidota bacterium]
MPIERSVFQRINNKADIQIGGYSNTNFHYLQAKLSPIDGGVPIDWTNMVANLSAGSFRFEIRNVETGWYKLEMRGLENGIQKGDITEVSKVGVGEVFVVAGQSNAQGGRPPEGGFYESTFYGAQHDKVNCIDYYTNSSASSFPLPVISKINEQTNISPKGKASWSWGLLGDKIAENWNVPVIFFNAAIGATKINQWSNGADGFPNYNEYENTTYYDGWPYVYLKKTLEYYVKIFGLRAILWHQGEENLPYFGQNGNEAIEYINNLENLINKSRIHSNNNISWVIALVSRYGDNTNSELIEAQHTVALKPNFNTFLGPNTDHIQPGAIYRDGGVHFRGTGLIELSEAWFASINNAEFLANSLPIAPSNNLTIINNQFVFGNSPVPCTDINQSLSSGDWNDPQIWSCGSVPNEQSVVIINEGHVVSISANNVFIKSLELKGTLNLSDDAQINFVE